MIQKSDIYVCIPAYNEAAVISPVIQLVAQLGYLNIYVVDDGSTDQTAEVVRKTKAKMIRHTINRGAGAATQTAIQWARESNLPYLLLMDADGQHLPNDIEAMAEKMDRENCDVVIGSRSLNGWSEMPKTRQWYNRMANCLTNLACKGRYSDSQSGFRLLNQKAIEKIDLSLDGFGFCSEMIFLAEQSGLEVVEVPIHTIYTPYSLAKGQNFFTGIQTALSIIGRILFR